MDRGRVEGILERVRAGDLAVGEAAGMLASGEIGFAHVDLQRRERCGYAEVVFAEGKTPEWVAGVARRLADAGQDCLATRISDDQAGVLRRDFPDAEIDEVARTFWLPHGDREPPRGRVLILTAGTSDLPVAREALNTATAMGADAELVADVGVAGLHRLLGHAEKLRAADVIVVVAGMDGALPSVVGGLVAVPVIAVPTSVGYGTAFGGVAALLTMLNACSANVVAVNIDAGFKGGYVAAAAARRMAAGNAL